MFQITGFHHRIFTGRLLLWGNTFPAGGLLHKETKIWSWQGYREHNRLTTTKAPSRKTEQTSCRQKNPNKNTWMCLPTHTTGVYKTKKKLRASCREFPVILKMKDIFSLKKKIKSKAPRGCFSARAADSSDSHPWKLVFYLQWLSCLSTLSFPEVS